MNWWNSYGNFDADQSGQYPLAGQVIAHYREVAGLSREQVATRLDIGEKAVYYAEREGRGLDSISRLRQVGSLLHVPLALLGLCSFPLGEMWWRDEYGDLPSGSDGWPDVGSVVRYYRRRKGWTQYDLAESLGISNLGVINMERKHAGLNSLSRRRALKFVLSIPPILLGLDGVHSAPAIVHAAARSTSTLPTLADLRAAQQRLWSGYYGGDAQSQLQTFGSLLSLNDALPSLPSTQRAAYLEQASLFYQAAGNVVLQSAQKSVVLSYMDAGIDYARASEDSALLSTALGRRSAALLELGDLPGAEKSIREALAVASPGDQVKRYPVASRVLSCRAQDKSDRVEVFKMLDNVTVNDRYQNGVDPNILLWCRGQSLLNLADNAPDRSKLLRQASDLLDRAELTAPDTARRHLIIKLSQARAYAGLREYEYAASAATEAFELMKQIKSVLYLPQIAEIYDALSKSLATPQVAHLGLLLFQVGAL